jgi:Mor family transcriptional regulator
MQRIVRDLADTLGLPDAIEIVRRWGGRTFYVPTKVRPHDPLALTLGLDSARRLVAAYGGQELSLPAERNALLDLRNESIVTAADKGMSHERIGLLYGLSRQGVAKILRAAQPVAGARQSLAVGLSGGTSTPQEITR